MLLKLQAEAHGLFVCSGFAVMTDHVGYALRLT